MPRPDGRRETRSVSRDAPKYCWSCPKREQVDRRGHPCPSSPERKAEVRRAVLGSIMAMTPEVRSTKSQLIVKRLLDLEAFKRASVVMAYVAMEMEVDPWGLIREAWALGKRVAMPRIHPPMGEPQVGQANGRTLRVFELRQELVDDPQDHSGLRPDVMGILEPKASAPEVPVGEVDLVLVPCVAYDRQGNRLGKGGGFYDRFLAQDDYRATSCGLAFSEQLFASLPRCPHDRPVDVVIAETGVLGTRKTG